MPPVFTDVGFDGGQFPNLVPQRSGIVAAKFSVATPTTVGLHRHDLLALLSGNQSPLMLRVPRLPAAFSF